MRVADEGFEVRGFVVQIRHVDRPTTLRPYDPLYNDLYRVGRSSRRGASSARNTAMVSSLQPHNYQIALLQRAISALLQTCRESLTVSDSLPKGFLQFHLLLRAM